MPPRRLDLERKPMNNPSNIVDAYVGARLRMRRVMLGMSQGKLGQLLGVTFQQIQKYEKGSNRISASRLRQAAQVLEVPVEFFYEGAPTQPSTDGEFDRVRRAALRRRLPRDGGGIPTQPRLPSHSRPESAPSHCRPRRFAGSAGGRRKRWICSLKRTNRSNLA